MTGLLFDIGGTNIRLAITRGEKRFLKPVMIKTPQRFSEGMKTIVSISKQLARERRITIAAGGIAGTLSTQQDRMVNSPHLQNWVGKPFLRSLSRALQAPVILENDSALVALGEAIYGAGRGHRIVAYLGIGTGLGGARIVDGRIDHTALGFEPGHQIIDRKSKARCRCGRYGDMESLVSGTAFERRFHKLPKDITDSKVWHEAAQTLAIGLSNVMVMWSPNIIVLGGSMMKKPGIDISDVRQALFENLKGFLPLPQLVQATLGDVGGLYGAVELLKQRLSSRSRKARWVLQNP